MLRRNALKRKTLKREALAWVVRLTSGEATRADAQALQAWRGQSPAHEQAYREAARLWRLTRQAAGSGGHVSPGAPHLRTGGLSPRRVRLRHPVTAAVVGFVVVSPVVIAMYRYFWHSMRQVD